MAEPTTHWQHYAYAATASNGQVLAAITGGGSLADLVRVDRSAGHTNIFPFASGGRVRVVGDLEITGSLHGTGGTLTGTLEVPALAAQQGGLRFSTETTDPVNLWTAWRQEDRRFRARLSRDDELVWSSAVGDAMTLTPAGVLSVEEGKRVATRTGMTGLPTSSPGGSGNLWRDSNGFLRIT